MSQVDSKEDDGDWSKRKGYSIRNWRWESRIMQVASEQIDKDKEVGEKVKRAGRI